jgi:predicted CoA-substrate-specific enzyme activase
MISAGLDIGALLTKAVVLRDGQIACSSICPTGESSSRSAEKILQQAMASLGKHTAEIEAVAATGVGKKEVHFTDRKINEITCAAKGAQFLYPDASGVLDMGGESTRAVKLDNNGDVVEFILNDKCAAGTGIFLDAMAGVLGIAVEEMGPLSLASEAEVNITSTCVVFAESEVISQVHRQTPKQDILRGIHKSIATRVYGLVNRIGLEGKIVAIGGLARNTGIISCLEEMTNQKLLVAEQPRIVSALGAALIAAQGGGEQ